MNSLATQRQGWQAKEVHMPIVIPTIKEAQLALGRVTHSFTTEYLSERRALALRDRSLTIDRTGKAVLESLFTLVEH